MPNINYDIIGSFKSDYDPIIDPQYLANWYESIDADAPNQKALIPFPGSKKRIVFEGLSATAEGRACFSYDGFMYVIIADKLFKVLETLTYVEIGTLDTTVGSISYDKNLTQIMIVDGGSGYIYDGTTFAKITDIHFPPDPISVTYLDGYFIVAQSSSSKFYISASEDGTSWAALDWAKITTEAENLRAISTLDRKVYVFSEHVIEGWYNGGGSDFPFVRDDNLIFQYGIAATYSLIEKENMMIWLAQTKKGALRIIKCSAGEITPLSTKALELEFQKYSTISDAKAYLQEINGHAFYIITFPTEDKTWVVDLTNGKIFALTMVDESRYFAQSHVVFNRKHYVTHYKEPNLYEVSRNYGTNNGEIMKKVRIGKNTKSKDGFSLLINSFELECRQGDMVHGQYPEDYYTDEDGEIYRDDAGEPYYDDTYDGLLKVIEDPVVYLSTSDNGGKTFGYEISQYLGESGDFKYRTFWTDLGTYNQFIAKITCYEKIGFVVIGATINITPVQR